MSMVREDAAPMMASGAKKMSPKAAPSDGEKSTATKLGIDPQRFAKERRRQIAGAKRDGK